MRLASFYSLLSILLILIIPSKISADVPVSKLLMYNHSSENINNAEMYNSQNRMVKKNFSNNDTNQVRKLNKEYIAKMLHNKRLFPYGKRRVIAYAGMNYDSLGNPDLQNMIDRLKEEGVNCYSYLIDRHSKQELAALPEFCNLASKNGMEVWVVLVPPSEEPGSKSIKDDKLRYPPYGLNYIEWAKNISKISKNYRNLTLLMIDDFVYNLNYFTPSYTKEVVASLKKENPDFLFGTTIYKEQINSKNYNFEPYKSIIDAVEWGYQHYAPDFPQYGISAASLPFEIQDFRKVFPNTLLVPCIYFNPHSSWKRKATESYLKSALELSYQDAGNSLVYCTPYPSTMHQKVVENFSKEKHTLVIENNYITVPVNYKQNFKGGYIDGWESYPPFQDTGFDPYFYCKRIDVPNGDKYALMFEYHPMFVTEHRMGFIKKLSLVAANNSKISFYYKAKGYGDYKGMKIVLYGNDDKQYSFDTTIIDNGKWNIEKVSVKNFRNAGMPIATGTGIDGFSVITYIPKTNPDINYKLFLGGLTIKADEPAKFEILNPKSDYLENINLIVPLHHYHSGEKFSISAKLPDEVKLESASLTLINPEGKIILKDVPLEFMPNKNLWSKDNIYSFSSNDILGQWRVKIAGLNKNGRSVKTGFKIWLTSRKMSHPRLLFSSKKIAYYKNLIKTNHWKNWWKSFVKDVARARETSNIGSIKFGADTSVIRRTSPTKLTLESLSKADITELDKVFLLPTLDHYFDIIQPAINMLENNALIYAVTGDPEVGNFAKQALIIISGWKTWTDPWFSARHRPTYYPIGELGVRAAFCYDIVYPLMTKKERTQVGEGLLRNCIKPAYNEYVLQDRIPSATSNWVGHNVSGGLACALALYDDNPKLGDFEPYISGLTKKLENLINNTLDTTGAWGEGIGYQAFAYSNILQAITALKNVLNLNLSSKGLLNSYKYFLYNYSNPHILDLGDSDPLLSTLSNYAWISSHSNDPVFQWLYMKSPRNNVLDFLFGNENGKKTPPNSLPESIQFPELGAVIFRSGWSPNDIVMNFRSGHFYNHQHFDQGNIQINAFGENLLPEAGWANYYKNPRYRSYFIQPAGHNTLLLDQDAGSQMSGDYLHFIKAANTSAHLKQFITSDFYSYAEGELAGLYRGKLKSYERNVIFLNKKFFVIYDKIESSKDPHEYDLLFHFNDTSEVSLKQNNIFTFTTDKAELYSQVVFPEKIKMKVIDGPLNFGIPIKMPGYVQVCNSDKKMNDNFLTILYPVKGHKNSSTLSNSISRLRGKNFEGIAVKLNNKTDRLLFNEGSSEIKTNDLLTDARIVELTTDHNHLNNFAAHDFTTLDYKNNKLITSDYPLTAVTELTGNSQDWKFESAYNCKAVIRINKAPQKIIFDNNQAEKNYSIKDNKLILSLSKGNNSLQIIY